METHAPSLGDQIARLRGTAQARETCVQWLDALIASIFARIFSRLEQILQLWQAGDLPLPAPSHPRHTQHRPAHPKSARAPRSTRQRPRVTKPRRTTPVIHLPRPTTPTPTSTRPRRRRSTARAPP